MMATAMPTMTVIIPTPTHLCCIITYKRAAITIIGDEMWRAQNIVAKISARLGQANINILNIDAQEETSRVIIITDDADDTLKKSIKAIHLERVKLV